MSLILAATALAAALQVPRATAPVIDGSVAHAEWTAAARVPLTNGGEALLQHDGSFLYVAFVVGRNGIGSLCTRAGADVHVLHASAALGTAVFREKKAIRDFTWTNRDTRDAAARAKFLAAEAWFANATPRGSHEREYQIALDGRTRIPIVLAFMSFAPDGPEEMHIWPERTSDSCASLDLAAGKTGSTSFAPETWGELTLKE